MSLKYFVHVSSISNLSDARYCSGMMVDSLGYNLDENSNNILSIDSVKEISQWVNGVKFIAEFYNSSEEHINKILENEIFDAIQLNIENKIKNINFNDSKVLIRISNPNEINEKEFYTYKPLNATDNKGLDGAARKLERIYKTIDWPFKTPSLEVSLYQSGKSRADLWQLAGLIALEQTVERANRACDLDFHQRQLWFGYKLASPCYCM